MATLTVYTGAGTGGTTTDGYLERAGVSEDFTTIRAGAGNNHDDTGAILAIRLTAGGGSPNFATLSRSILTFDTSSIGGGSTINDATLSLWDLGISINNLGSTNFHVCGATPASDNDLANSDYGQTLNTSFGSIAYASITSGAYNAITLNASGEAAIDKAGITALSMKTEWDVNGSFTGSYSAGNTTSFFPYAGDQTGTTNDPKLVINYTPYAGDISSVYGVAIGSVASVSGVAIANISSVDGVSNV